MTTILITGGAGFIGSHFVDYIFETRPDWQIIVLDLLTYAGNPENIRDEIKQSERFEFVMGNVANMDLVSTLVSRSDYVVHFAAETHVARSIFDNRIFYETDVLGTQAVSHAIVKHKERIKLFIHVSSSEVYGTAVEDPMTEAHPLNPMSPYASAKTGADRLVYSYVQTYRIPAVILRPFNQFGPRQHLEKVIPRFITSAILNEPLTIHGSGLARRDWLYVEETCQRIGKCFDVPRDTISGEAINLGSGFELDVLSIAKQIVQKLGRSESLITHIGDRLGQVSRHISSTEKGEKLLGFGTAPSFETGLNRTIDWYLNNRSWWNKMLWMRSIPIRTADGKIEKH